MTTKNTPGPWILEAIFPDKTKGQTFEPRVSILGPSSMGLVRLADIPDCDKDSEEYANARLIAKAPELQEALQWIVDGYLAGEPLTGPKIAHGIAEARALLAEIDGK